MPTYEYACTSCHHEWEAEHSMKADPLRECPACKQQTAKRQISRGTGFILKGSGWYSDLYSGSSNKSDEGKPAAKAESKSEGAPAAPAAATSDSSSSSAPATVTKTEITSSPSGTTVTKTTEKV